MESDFYLKRSQKLRFSEYPLSLSAIDMNIADVHVLHNHDEIEFLYVMKGRAYIMCGDENILASEGDIIFINQNVKHSISLVGNNDGLMYSIVVHPSFIVDIGNVEMETKYLNPIIADASFTSLHLSYSDSMYEKFLVPVRQLVELNTDKCTGYELLSKACILQLWKYLYDKIPAYNNIFSNVTARTANQDSQRVKQAVIYIREHFMEPITLNDIADSILVSKSECCRCFKRVKGISPIEYLMKYRISQSVKHMHKKTHESISEIAGLVGFNNTSYYNKVFKKIMGCTPTEYRHTLRK